MKWLLVLLIVALISQLVLYIYSRKLKKKFRDNVLEKYNLKTPKDAWDALADPNIPDEDKDEIRKLYHGEE